MGASMSRKLEVRALGYAPKGGRDGEEVGKQL